VWPAGTTVTVAGEIASRFGQRTLRISEADLVRGADASLPAVQPIDTGAAGETDEGRRVEVSGTVTASPDELSDGLGITVDDGTGPVRAVIGPAALDGRTIKTGLVVTVRGPLGQRDSSGTGTAGYRVHATLPASWRSSSRHLAHADSVTDAHAHALADRRSAIAHADCHHDARSDADRDTDADHDTDPDPDTDVDSDADVDRSGPRDADRVEGDDGRRGHRRGRTNGLHIADRDRRCDRGHRRPRRSRRADLPRGTRLVVTGKLAAPYGQLEVKPGATDVHVLGSGSPPEPTGSTT
jgi:hypothetical protein